MCVPMMLVVTMRMIVRDCLMDMLGFMLVMWSYTPIPIRIAAAASTGVSGS